MEPDIPPSEAPISPPWNTTVKVVAGVLAIVLIGLAAYAFRAIFVPLIVGGIIAYVLSPLVRQASRRLPLSRGLATLLVFLALIAILIPIGLLLVQEIAREVVALEGRLLNAIAWLNAASGDTISIFGFEFVIGNLREAITTQLIATIRAIAPNTVGIALNAVRSVVIAIFTLFIGFYLTRDANTAVEAIKRLAPPAYQRDANILLGEINAVWAAYLRGQFILSGTVAAILTVLSAALGLPQPLLLGLWGGLLEFLPSIGNMLWGTTAVILAIVEGSSTLAVPQGVFVVIVALAAVAFSQLDMNVLIPNILGGQVQLHPVVVLIGVIIGLTIGGVLGVALAAPMIASLRVIGRYVYAKLFDLPPFPGLGPPAGMARAHAAAVESEATREAGISPASKPGEVNGPTEGEQARQSEAGASASSKSAGSR